MRLNDLTGKHFGRLKVLSRAENATDGHAQWLCECSCDRRVVVTSQSLVCGLTNSCGCYRRDILKARGKSWKRSVCV